MNRSEIIAIQKRIGTVPDGFWGPKSTKACQDHLRSLMPHPNPWPRADQASLNEFYGPPGQEDKLAMIDVSRLGVDFEDSPVNLIRCHPKIALSLLRFITAVSKSRFCYILSDYAGCYNNRAMRGGSLPSLHARGAAIDFRPATNGNRMHWPVASDMPLEVMEMAAAEGAVAAGAFWGRDAMHFQWTQP